MKFGFNTSSEVCSDSISVDVEDGKIAEVQFNGGCPGQLPEIADGDDPHNWGGCAAQAWSVSEFYRVGKMVWPEYRREAAGENAS